MTKTVRRIARAIAHRRPVKRDRKAPGEDLAPLARELRALNRNLRATPATTSTALVPASRAELAPPSFMLSSFSEEAVMGALGLAELKLTPEEEKILAEPVDVSRVSIKPTGQPYLSHPEYTRWLGRAFGRIGWSIVPLGKPSMTNDVVYQQYVLWVHGKPVAQAWGEQPYNSNNREQTYGDALEATVASAIRRCSKRLGVGLELWDRQWLDEWVANHAIRVKTFSYSYREKRKVVSYKWRKLKQQPLADEVVDDGMTADETDQVPEQERDARPEPAQRRTAPAPRREERRDDRRPPPRATHTDASRENPISEKQVRRLYAIMSRHGRDEEYVRAWIARRYGIERLHAIPRAIYEEICDAVEGEESLR